MIFRDVYAEINLNAIRHNFKEIRRRVKCKLCAVVKANAYEHGALEVSKVAVERAHKFFELHDITSEKQLGMRNA